MFLNDIKYDWIGDISDDWEIKRIKNLFYLKKEVSDNPEEEEILSLTMGGIIKRDISSNEGQLPETYKGYTKIYPDDMVMNPMDLKSGWVDRSKYDGIISPSYYVLNKLYDDLDIGFFNYQLQRHYKERIFFSFGQGISYDYRWGLGRETILNFPIIVPPLKIQTQIVSFLDTKTQKIDELIEKTEQKIKLLKEKQTSLINHCVTKGLNPNVEMKDSGVKWIGEIPSHWDIKKVKFVSNIKRGSSPRPIDDPKYFEDGGEYGWVRISDVTKCGKYLTNTIQQLSEIGKSCSLPLENDSLCMSISGSVGKVFITRIKCCIHDGFVSFNNLLINQEFLYLLLTNKELYSEDRKLGTQFNINSQLVGNKKIPIPHITEQTKIVEYLDEQNQKIDSTIENETQRIELLKEYRQSLISEVVMGKVDVREWNK